MKIINRLSRSSRNWLTTTIKSEKSSIKFFNEDLLEVSKSTSHLPQIGYRMEQKFKENAPPVDVGILFVPEDRKNGRHIEKSLRNLYPDISVLTSDGITPGQSLHTFYKRLVTKSEHLIVVISETLLNNLLFQVIASEVFSKPNLSYFFTDEAYKNHQKWKFHFRDVVGGSRTPDYKDWVRKFVAQMECSRRSTKNELTRRLSSSSLR